MVETEYIRNQIAAVARNRPSLRAQSIPIIPQIPPAKKSGFLTSFLVACIALVSVATLGGVAAKGMGWDWRGKPVETVVVERPQPQPQTERYMTQAEASEWMASVDSRIAEQESMLKKSNHRVWLLGIAHNENTSMAQAIDRKYHPNEPTDYITFDREWKMNRMPRSMKLDTEQHDKLQQNVR